MSGVDRRRILRQIGLAAVGAGAAAAASAADAPAVAAPGKVAFDVPRVGIPLVGGGDVFPVRRIYCIGRNYAAHALERGADPTREPPFFFQKPTDAIQVVRAGETLAHPYPPLTQNYHHEIELVAAIGRGGRDIPVERALEHVFGYTVGLDMTRRDLQNEAAAAKHPWEIGKSFDHSAVVGELLPATGGLTFAKGAIWLKVNGVTRQSSDLSKMLWSVAEQIAKLSESSELFPGDIVYSGTPENVGPVVRGDVMTGHIDGLADIRVKVV